LDGRSRCRRTNRCTRSKYDCSVRYERCRIRISRRVASIHSDQATGAAWPGSAAPTADALSAGLSGSVLAGGSGKRRAYPVRQNQRIASFRRSSFHGSGCCDATVLGYVLSAIGYCLLMRVHRNPSAPTETQIPPEGDGIAFAVGRRKGRPRQYFRPLGEVEPPVRLRIFRSCSHRPFWLPDAPPTGDIPASGDGANAFSYTKLRVVEKPQSGA